MKYVFVDNFNEVPYDAGKARCDIEEILKRNGYTPITVYNRKHKIIGKIADILKLLHVIIHTMYRDTVVLQYPYNFVMLRIIIFFLKLKRCYITILIHDVNYIREKKEINSLEITVLNAVDYLIVHNKRMKERLSVDGVKTPMYTLEVFDYLFQGDIKEKKNGNVIVFAGNLEKSSFIYYLDSIPNLSFNLYGNNFQSGKVHNNIIYRGSFLPNDLPSILEGNYGLVWDGPTTKSCTEAYGEYLIYNTPHKLSLYIVANLPIIIWSKAAMSQFVVRNKIGFCVDSLDEIPSKISKISDTEYAEMQNNLKIISKKIQRGSCILLALKEI